MSFSRGQPMLQPGHSIPDSHAVSAAKTLPWLACTRVRLWSRFGIGLLACFFVPITAGARSVPSADLRGPEAKPLVPEAWNGLVGGGRVPLRMIVFKPAKAKH